MSEQFKQNTSIGPMRLGYILAFFKFMREINSDHETRTYYRYMVFKGPKDFLRLFTYFVFQSLCPKIGIRFTGTGIILSCLIDPTTRRIYGICHVEIHSLKGNGSDEGELGIVLTRERIGKGMGKTLMEHCLARCRASGLSKVTLTVDVDNSRAVNLYRNMGFVIIRKVEKGDIRYLTGEMVDYYGMELKL